MLTIKLRILKLSVTHVGDVQSWIESAGFEPFEMKVKVLCQIADKEMADLALHLTHIGVRDFAKSTHSAQSNS